MFSARGPIRILLTIVCFTLVRGAAHAQDVASPPAYLAAVEGTATLDRGGDAQPALPNMPFVEGDRLRTANGRVEIDFPDGTAIEVGPDSEVESVSATRVRLLAGTMDHVQPRAAVQSASSQYLPDDLQRYGPEFDANGAWSYDASYGNVWYPRVAADWRPYYNGSWASVPSYGWTWIGADSWAWPTHHYGRWGFGHNAWFWIPGRAWSAAWVSWGLADDYVSWCPLGFDGRPVFALSLGFGARSLFGWTVVPRNRFGFRAFDARRFAIDPHRLDVRTSFAHATRLPSGFGRERAFAGARAFDRGFDRGRAAPAVSARAGAFADRRVAGFDGARQTPRVNAFTPRSAPSSLPRSAAIGPRSSYAASAPRYSPSMPRYSSSGPRYSAAAPRYTPSAPVMRQQRQMSRPAYQAGPARQPGASFRGSERSAAPRGGGSSGGHGGGGGGGGNASRSSSHGGGGHRR